jgi:hypothetical protein
MKRLLYLFIVLATCSIAYSQQDYFKHEVSLSYGFQPILSVPDVIPPSQNYIEGGGYYYYTLVNKKNIGTLNLSYLYHLSKSFAVGATYAYGNVTQDVVITTSRSFGKYNSKYHLLMPTVKYEWSHAGAFCLYSRVALGVYYTPKADADIHTLFVGDFIMEQKSRVALAWQVVPLGIELRFIKHFALFVEGGAGSSGYGLAGVKAFF